jgi:hypothetical protein
MTAVPSRRAALGFLARSAAQASAIAVAGSALALSPVHLDAELLAMQPAIDAADRELDAALEAIDKAGEAYDAMDVPDEPAQPDGPVFSAEEQKALDAFAAMTRARGKQPSPAWAAYEEAVQDWKRETERLEAECGLTAANEAEDAAHKTIRLISVALAITPAKTMAGLIFKARYAERNDYEEDVMTSIADDLLAMADQASEGANV